MTSDRVYNATKIEEEILKWWDERDIQRKVKIRREGCRKFYFLDGPPYVTNPPHVGTAWNKILKDIIIRYKRMRGHDVHDKPGYDCHGLPIEVKVESLLGIRDKKEIEERGVDFFVEKCKEFAQTNEKLQTSIFKRLGVWMDWDSPYLTYKNDYIESTWWAIKEAYKKGLIEKGLKVVHWCPRCETALSGYEITDEYRVVQDPSIFVKFPLKGRRREYIVVWTTTPWTIPANTAIMVHSKITYVKAKVGDEVLILAKDRCEFLFSDLLNVKYEILEEFEGKLLEGLEYEHPLEEEVPIHKGLKGGHRVILSDEYVRLEEGTGCVHSAPGHGEEDFEAGRKYDLPILTLIDSRGIFLSKDSKYNGLTIKEVNRAVIADLERKGYLLYKGYVHHKYPHCWRCKSPLILRATEQWFLKVTQIKDQLIQESEKVKWVPEWAGSKRFRDWLIGARDWVISRQRYWGIPMPIWICEKCGEREVVGSVKELKEKAISAIESEMDLHKPWIDNVLLKCKCGGVMKRVPDVLDVWIDSGVASWASLGFPKNGEVFKKLWPADCILEAHDQTRGWFYSQMGIGVAVFGKSPYKCVVMHGHTLDEKGQKMSKSLGNFISPIDVVEKYGSDALRLYEVQHTTWEDFNFKMTELKSTYSLLNTFWNLCNFAITYMKLDEFDARKYALEEYIDKMPLEDKWILSKLNSLLKAVTEDMENYYFHDAARKLVKFITEDLSRWYLRLVRKRVWIEENRIEKITAYITLYRVLRTLLILMAPFTPFITEKIYRNYFAEKEGVESVHMLDWPIVDEKLIDKSLEDSMEIAKDIVYACYTARQKTGLKLRWPLRRICIHVKNREYIPCVRKLDNIIKTLCNVKELVLTDRLETVHSEGKYCAIAVETTMDEELISEALAREIVRRVQAMRKELDLEVDEFVEVYLSFSKDVNLQRVRKFEEYIKGEVRAERLYMGVNVETKGESIRTWDILDERVTIGIVKKRK